MALVPSAWARTCSSPWTVTPALGQGVQGERQEGVRDVLVDEQGLGGVADAGALGLGVDQDVDRHRQVRLGVDVDVAVAGAGLDDGDRGLLDDRTDQGGAAARDEDVDQAAGPHQLPYGVAALARDELHRVGGEARAADGVAQDPDQGGVGGVRGGGAAQQDRVAGLQAEGGGVHGDVGAGLVDDADHAEGDADLAQVDAVGQGRAAHHLTDRVGQRGHVPYIGGDGPDALRGEGEPVDDALARPGLAGPLDVLRVGLDDLGGPHFEGVRDGQQRVVLGRARKWRDICGGGAGPVGGLRDRGQVVVGRERGHARRVMRALRAYGTYPVMRDGRPEGRTPSGPVRRASAHGPAPGSRGVSTGARRRGRRAVARTPPRCAGGRSRGR